MQALIDTYGRYFDVAPVETDEQLNQVYRLRYQVYCIETGFESIDEHPLGVERDEFDARSVHSLLLHHKSGLTAGTVRLVLPDPADLSAPFPIEKHGGDAIERPIGGAERAHLAEISRFCISKEFKRRLEETPSLWGNTAEDAELMSELDQRRLIPHITVGLFAAIVRMSAEHDIKYWYALMEPALLRLLGRFAIRFHPIGPIMDHHGERQPCFASVDQVLSDMRAECYPVWEYITARGSYWPGPAEVSAEVKDISIIKR